MKISNFIKRSLFIGISFFAVSGIYAGDIVLKDKGTPPLPDPGTNRLVTEFPVTATEDNSDLAVYFEEALGDATITVYNVSEQVVYQTVINSNSQSAATIDISAWSSGDYTITINYGTTNLIGEFTIE